MSSLVCCFLCRFFVFLMISSADLVSSEKNQFYSLKALCKEDSNSDYYVPVMEAIDGAVLEARNEQNLDCIMTFHTHSILQRFMIHFDFLQLDCTDHIYIYDGAHAFGKYKKDISCKTNQEDIERIITNTNYVTLKYVTEAGIKNSNGFKLILTAMKTPKLHCADFRCKLSKLCISNDLLCDGVNHCIDGSDEEPYSLCKNKKTTQDSIFLQLKKTFAFLSKVCKLLSPF